MSIRPSLRCRAGLVGLACFLFATSLYAQDSPQLDLVEQLSARKDQFLARRLMLVDSTEQVVFFGLYRGFTEAMLELDQKKLAARDELRRALDFTHNPKAMVTHALATLEVDQKKLSLRRAFFDQIHSRFGPTTASALVLAEVDWQREIGRLIEEYRQGNPGSQPLSTGKQ